MNEQTAVFNLGIASPSANLRLSVALLYVSRVTSSRDESIRCLFGHLFGKRYCKLSRLTCKGNFDRCFLVSFLYFHNFIFILSTEGVFKSSLKVRINSDSLSVRGIGLVPPPSNLIMCGIPLNT